MAGSITAMRSFAGHWEVSTTNTFIDVCEAGPATKRSHSAPPSLARAEGQAATQRKQQPVAANRRFEQPAAAGRLGIPICLAAATRQRAPAFVHPLVSCLGVVECHMVTICMRRSDLEPWGMDLAFEHVGCPNACLVVTNVRDNSVFASWNKLCWCWCRYIRSGDCILEAEGAASCDDVVQLLRQQRLIRLRFWRRGRASCGCPRTVPMLVLQRQMPTLLPVDGL